MVSSGSLILTVTRACNLRCSYCPTAKEGWPSLSTADAAHAVDLFADRYGGGDVKLFGGEPLLVPDVVRSAIDRAALRPEVRRIYLSTNGLGLDEGWLAYLADVDKAILTISIDGAPSDHRTLRRSLPGVADTYEHLMGLLPALRQQPRVVFTQTIAPSTAARAHDNFRHLLGLGLWRFNLLPGYFLPWTDEQLRALEAAFDVIAVEVRDRWRAGERLYLRNLFTRAPTPFFNAGLVVDADGRIHPSNVGLSSALSDLLDLTCVGTLADPPSLDALARKSQTINALLAEHVPERVWQSTLAVDALLTRFCEGLYPDFARQRRRRRAA